MDRQRIVPVRPVPWRAEDGEMAEEFSRQALYVVMLAMSLAVFVNFVKAFNRSHRKKQLNEEQREAEREAVLLLTKAQRLLMADERNADEALRLRLAVTRDILPPHKLYIAGQHPQSLLKDVDRRIHQARFKHYRRGDETETAAAGPSAAPRSNAVRPAKIPRYARAAGRERRRMFWSYASMIVCCIALAAMVVFMGQCESGRDQWRNSFEWLGE